MLDGLSRAATASTQAVRVHLVWLRADGVLVLIATTLKRGASYNDSWSISPSLGLVSATVLDASMPDRPRYVSRASVAESPLESDTTYTFSYGIVMHGADTAWAGSGSLALTVGPDGSLTPIGGSVSCASSPTP